MYDDVIQRFKDIYLIPYYLFSAIFIIVCKPHVDYPEETILSAILKILPILSLIGFVYLKFQNGKTMDSVYSSYIILGLGISTLGDICLVWRQTLFVPALFFFAIAHVWYVLALLTKYSKSKYKGLFIYLTLASFCFISEGVECCLMKVCVFVYTVLVSGTGFLGTAHFENEKSTAAKLSALAGVLFMISDTIIGVDKWRFGILGSEFFVMATYYTAQASFALSTVN